MEDPEIRELYKGILYSKHPRAHLSPWRVHLFFQGKHIILGQFKNLKDALWERDLFLKHKGDYEKICEDNTINPYLELDLPQFPNFRTRGSIPGTKYNLYAYQSNVEKTVKTICNQMKKEDNLKLKQVSEYLGVSSNTINNRLHNFNLTFTKFKFLFFNNKEKLLELIPYLQKEDLGVVDL